MNLVGCSAFFASLALDPLSRARKGSAWLADAGEFDPFAHAVDRIRFAFSGKVERVRLAVVSGCAAAFLAGSAFACVPARAMATRGG